MSYDGASQKRRRWGRALAACLLVTAVTGCGGGDEPRGPGPRETSLRDQLGDTTDPGSVAFPPTGGRTLQEVADAVGRVGPQLALATSVFTPGENRLAFGVIDEQTGFVYGPSAVYVARGPDAKAEGPYLAPADLLVTEAPYRSRQAATDKDPFAAIYGAKVPFDRPGRYVVLAMTDVKGAFVVSPGRVTVRSKADDRIPDVGEPAPEVTTDTVAAAGGNVESVETRLPPDSMHGTDFAEVVGRKPVALLFSTPQLCESRVCGPVTDIAEQMKARYGDRVEFIHQEVYVDNDPSKGVRKPLKGFNLDTEPWLFTVGADGDVAARLQGSFGLDSFETAVKAALAGD